MINSKLDKIKSKSDELTAVLESMFQEIVRQT